MTPANATKFKLLAKKLEETVEENANAKTATFVLLDAIQVIQGILVDLFFRPEVNSQ